MAVVPQYVPSERPDFGIFEVHFGNEKKRGRGRTVQYCTAYGSLYPDKHVHLHTQAVRITDFISYREMEEYLESFGSVRIVWLSAPIAVSRFPDEREPS